MRKVTIVSVLLSVMVAGMAQGDTIRFRGNGSWDMLEGVGQVEGWQSVDAPDSTDTVRASWGGSTITLNYETTVKNFELGVDQSGEFHIQNGGHLITLDSSRVGNNGNDAGTTGTLTIDAGGEVTVGSWLGIGHTTPGFATVSGTLNADSHLWMGETSDADSVGSLIINNGGIVIVSGNLGMGTINASTPSGGSATITVNSGGLLDLDQWSNANSIQPGSVLSINGTGVVTVGGDRVNAANDYFGAGKITSDLGGILATHDGDSNTTTIVGMIIPEPSTLALMGFAGIALAFRRTRRKS